MPTSFFCYTKISSRIKLQRCLLLVTQVNLISLEESLFAQKPPKLFNFCVVMELWTRRTTKTITMKKKQNKIWAIIISLQYFSIHLNMSFPANRTLRTNFNVIHTLVFESAHDYKILIFGADKIWWGFWQSRTRFENVVCRSPNSFRQTSMRSIGVFLYLSNWKQTVSSIESTIRFCYKLVFL